MPEEQDDLYQSQIDNCPIHKWISIDKYLTSNRVPKNLWQPFHELILARGKFPKNISNDQVKKFGKLAVEITKKNKLTPIEGHGLLIMFTQLIQQWIGSDSKNN